MSQKNIFSILEIEPTDDRRTIKKAYAKLVTKYHPEEYPEKWKEIHEAYEAAIARVGWGKNSQLLEENVSETVIKNEKTAILPKLSERNAPELIIKTEKPLKSSEKNTPKSVMKTEKFLKSAGEMDSLFDNIGVLAREQQQQDNEAFKRELQSVMYAFRKMSSEKKLDLKEWKDFFYQETRLPYICTGEFLEMLGDCFINRKIDAEMYQFLKEQLTVITKYSRDRNIVLKQIGLLNPVEYAQNIIDKAYKKKRRTKERGIRTSSVPKQSKPAIGFLLVIVLMILIRVMAAQLHDKREESLRIPEIQEIPEAVLENMMPELMTVENDGDIMRSHISILPNKIQIGDSREVMVKAFGEPDEIRELQENEDYEEAVYLYMEFGEKLVIVLESDVIIDIYYEYTMASAVSDGANGTTPSVAQ